MKHSTQDKPKRDDRTRLNLSIIGYKQIISSVRKKTVNYLNQIPRQFALPLNLAFCLCLTSVACSQTFHELSPISDAEGFAAPYVGVSDGRLLVAGGANFPDKPRWETDKVWYDSIFVLDKPDGKWRKIPGKLPCLLYTSDAADE